jgi:outer membrane protein TolC
MNRLQHFLSASRRFTLRSIFPAILWLGAYPLMAQATDEPAAFSIKDCINYASQNNSNLKIARFDERIAQQQVNQIRGRGLPQININGTFEDRLKVPLLVIPGAGSFLGGGDTTGVGSGSNNGNNARGQGIPLGFKYNSSLTGEVTQMIIDPSFWIGLKAAKSSNQLYRQTTQQVSEQTAYDIANAYYQVIVVEKQLQLLQANLERTKATLATTELQYKNGVAKKVDLNRLRVNASNLESQITQAGSNLVQVTNVLKFQMGMPLTQPIALSDTVLTFNQDESVLASVPENFYENRIESKILKTNLQLQELDRKNTIAGYFPSLVQQSKLRARQLEERISFTRQSINLEVSNAFTQYRNTLQRIEDEQQNVQLAQEVYQVTQLEFREGISTSTDVVTAETALRQAQTTYITTLLDLYTARLDLERAKGNLLSYLNSK